MSDNRNLVPYLKKLDTDPKSLSADDIYEALDIILNSSAVPDVQISGFLIGSRIVSRDHEVDFIHTAVSRLQKDACKIDRSKLGGKMFVDIVGTGGDGKNTFNVSTTAAIVAAGMGMDVCKHGGPASTSKSGASDVLSALGIDLSKVNESTAPHLLNNSKFCYLSGPVFHPVLGRTKTIRKNMGIPCVFNLVGPLLNPAPLRARIIGVYSPKLGRVFAETVKELTTEAGLPQEALIVCGDEGLDEISCAGKTHWWRLHNGDITEGTFSPEDFGLKTYPLSEVASGTPEENADTINKLLNNELAKDDPILTYVLLQAAAIGVVAGVADDWKDGVAKARESIESGKAKAALEHFKELI